ncbi:MAG: membrane protein insertion efficiency factor YidD [Acidobacteria bacterium]|nr:membrane protein insertion efficiency factor YidD [Acidobacteriota bacterium]
MNAEPSDVHGAPSRRTAGRAPHSLRRVVAGACVLVAALLAVDVSRPPRRQVTARVVISLARTYQRAVPESGPLRGKCRLTPTCSAYAIEVVQRYGALRGGWLAARRILRCGPWTPRGTVDRPPASLPE